MGLILKEIIMKLRLFGSMGASIFTLLTLITILVVSISNVNASMITFRFEGEMDRVDNELSSAFSEGDQFTGTYTFDSDALPEGDEIVIPGAGGVSFPDAISAMSFTSRSYRASATNGSVFRDIDTSSSKDIFVNISPVLGQSAGRFLPSRFSLTWVPNEFFTGSDDRVLTEPFFDPNLPADVVFFEDFSNGAFFDVDGNQLTIQLFRENPDQPLFLSDGTLFEFRGNGSMRFSFVNNDQEEADIFGQLSSVTVVPIPAAVWLFGTGLLGLITFTKRKQLA